MQTNVFPHQTAFYKGKVRDVYTIDDRLLVMIASNRISAFDVILPKPIPYKGQVLNQIAAYMLKSTKDICRNWLLDVPAPNASVGLKCDPFKIEMVVRGNLTGHAWRTYSSGNKVLCGVHMPEGLKDGVRASVRAATAATRGEVRRLKGGPVRRAAMRLARPGSRADGVLEPEGRANRPGREIEA